VLPAASTTVQVTVVVPTGKVAGASLETVATEQLSAAVGVPNETFVAEQVPASTEAATAAGAVIVGNCRSLIVTVKEAVAVKP